MAPFQRKSFDLIGNLDIVQQLSTDLLLADIN